MADADIASSADTVTGRTVLAVTGMTCAACEGRVEKKLGKVPGVVGVKASSTRGRVEVQWAGPEDRAALADAVAAAGYAVGKPRWWSPDAKVWRTFLIAVVVVTLVVIAAKLAGWDRLSSGVGDLEAGGLAVVLLLGLAAGVSTCMALTGGLVLAAMSAHQQKLERTQPDTMPSRPQRLRPLFVFLGGRIVGFAVLGALLGLVGASITIPTWLLAVMMLGVGVVMALLGVRLTEISPRIAGWSLTLPSSWGRRMGLEEKAEGSYSDVRTALLGAATFFLPCGFTQAAQLFALSTGSPAYAAAIMGVFALGTAPGLLVLGGLPEFLPHKHRTAMLRGLGVLVLAFAVLNLQSGMRLAGFDLANPLGRAPEVASAGVTPNVTVTPDLQTLKMDQVTDGYLPVDSVVLAGIPIKWVMTSYDPQSCAIALRSPAIGVSVTLKKGENVIDVPAQQPGRITFSCSMGMYGGTITVIEPGGAATAS